MGAHRPMTRKRFMPHNREADLICANCNTPVIDATAFVVWCGKEETVVPSTELNDAEAQV